MKRHPTEDQIHRALVEHIRLRQVPGVIWWHTPNGGHRSKAAAGKMKALGQKPGIPDLVFFIDGRAHFLELKAGNGRASPEQREVIGQLRGQGVVVEIARGLDPAIETLERWGVIYPEGYFARRRQEATVHGTA